VSLAESKATAAAQHASREVLLSLREVYKQYPRADRPTTALESVTLDIHRGEFLAIVGPSGCGKSTLLQIAAGLIKATSGTVTLSGKMVAGPPPEIVYLFQQYTKSLFPWRKVLDNVAFPLERKAMSRADRKARAEFYLSMVGLSEFGNHYPWQLSGGMQQRVAIARALAAAPRVLLMDEPFSAVDALTRLDLQSMILDIWHHQTDLTAVLITHDVDEAVYLADRVALLRRQPSAISHIFETGLPRPRHPIETREAQPFLKLRHELLNLLLERSR
jgi:NitT/TauT family transport system ATP-binding protein